MNLAQIRNKLEQLKGQKSLIEQSLSSINKDIRISEREISQWEEARDIVRTVAQITQSQLEYKISELTTLAINSIFPQPYKFLTEFVLRRNKTEVDFFVQDKEGNKYAPMDANGGGLVDIISFGLRLTMLTIRRPVLNRIIVLDEPFRFLSRDLQVRAGELLKKLSLQFGIQFIIVSHDTALIDCADKVFDVKKENHISIICEKYGGKNENFN